MVYAKIGLFEPRLQESSEFFKALSHPARLQILQYLAQAKTCISGDISTELPLSRTTVGQHLEVLKKANLIKGEISGVRTKYCLNPMGLTKLKEFIEYFMEEMESNDNQKC